MNADEDLYGWSHTGGSFFTGGMPTRAEALENVRGIAATLEHTGPVYTCKRRPYRIAELAKLSFEKVSVGIHSHIVDRRFDSLIGGESGGFLDSLENIPVDVTRELEKALLDTLTAWADKHDLQPDFWEPVEIEEHPAKGDES